ncbi:hypothetical protein K443DRAFT_7743 [Laccaria amethystina LaAM-08-1]|uniref:Uncharacterized protein n=1 Tax=Laccaria amethystina LaAM-08-1 TaxID=1095629 RepID=A0A0C9X5K0_9AGAR|nr:hypothetical protein K443DRAFT_7743 [Laccaria amethystina LaAM-08-1]
MPLSTTSRKGQPATDLQTVQNPEHALNMLSSAKSRKGTPAADLHPVQNPEHALPVQNPEHALVSNKQDRPAR